jgi:hypothetical protein
MKKSLQMSNKMRLTPESVNLQKTFNYFLLSKLLFKTLAGNDKKRAKKLNLISFARQISNGYDPCLSLRKNHDVYQIVLTFRLPGWLNDTQLGRLMDDVALSLSCDGTVYTNGYLNVAGLVVS